MPGSKNTIAVLVLSGILFAPWAWAQDDLSPPTDVVLSFKETRAGQQEKCGGGSLVDAVNCVTLMIEGAGEDGQIHSLAQLGLTLNPVIRPKDNFKTVTVYVRAEGGSPSVSPYFENQAEVEAGTESDARLVRERLKRWSLNLNSQQIQELRTTGKTQVPISRPFEGLKVLSLENPPAILTLILPTRIAKTAEGAKEGEAY